MIERTLRLIGSIPHDKLLHFLCGLLIAQVAYIFSPTWALMLPGLVGAAKEGYDHAHPNHTADWWDFHATVLGGLAGWFLIWAVLR